MYLQIATIAAVCALPYIGGRCWAASYPRQVKGSAMLIENGHLLESAIHHLPFGIMVVDAHRKVLATNRAAKDILQTRDALVERQSVLRAYQREEDERLTQALAEATAVRSNSAWSSCIRLSRRSGKSAYTAIVSPLFEAVEMRSPVGSRAALITITNPDREHSSDLVKPGFPRWPRQALTTDANLMSVQPLLSRDCSEINQPVVRGWGWRLSMRFDQACW